MWQIYAYNEDIFGSYVISLKKVQLYLDEHYETGATTSKPIGATQVPLLQVSDLHFTFLMDHLYVLVVLSLLFSLHSCVRHLCHVETDCCS